MSMQVGKLEETGLHAHVPPVLGYPVSPMDVDHFLYTFTGLTSLMEITFATCDWVQG